MKKKKIILLVILGLIIISILILFLNRWNTNIYMELMESEKCNKMDLEIKIDDITVFNDTIYKRTVLFPYEINIPLKIGNHDMLIVSNEIGLYERKKIFIFYNQYIFITFHGGNKPAFNVDIGYNPFRYD